MGLYCKKFTLGEVKVSPSLWLSLVLSLTHTRKRTHTCTSRSPPTSYDGIPGWKTSSGGAGGCRSRPRHPWMGGALTGARRVFSTFKSSGAGPSDKPRCVIDLGRLSALPARLRSARTTSARSASCSQVVASLRVNFAANYDFTLKRAK